MGLLHFAGTTALVVAGGLNFEAAEQAAEKYAEYVAQANVEEITDTEKAELMEQASDQLEEKNDGNRNGILLLGAGAIMGAAGFLALINDENAGKAERIKQQAHDHFTKGKW